jgi:hypothetical protein
MKKVLAELNNTITALEKLGLVKEAENLDKIFVKVAQLIPGLGQAVQQVGPFVDFQKFTLPKQQQLGNVPVGSNAWNKSIQIALGMSPNMADGVWGPQSQKMLDNFKMKNPRNFDAMLANRIKPLTAPKQPSPPAPGSGPSPVDY